MLLKATEQQILKILLQKKTFQRAEELTGVPWQAIAAVWFRESMSVSLPKRPGGCFQFDPPTRSLAWKELMLKQYAPSVTGEVKRLMIESFGKSFIMDAIWAACIMRNNCKPKITPKASDEDIKQALYGYNGAAYGSVERSPYVMNGYSPAHKDLVIRGTVKRPDGTDEWVEHVDTRPGAFNVYKQLKAIQA